MRKCIVLIIVFVSFSGNAQEEFGNYAGISSRFMALYNGGDYDGIFKLFDVDMKKALPREQTIEFLANNVNKTMGLIQKMEFNKLRNGAHVYRTTFDNAVADITISLNPNNEINGLYIAPARTIEKPVIERNITEMILPFNEEWFVFWGGTTLEQNYHMVSDDQKYAYDILMVKNGSSYEGDSKKNEKRLDILIS